MHIDNIMKSKIVNIYTVFKNKYNSVYELIERLYNIYNEKYDNKNSEGDYYKKRMVLSSLSLLENYLEKYGGNLKSEKLCRDYIVLCSVVCYWIVEKFVSDYEIHIKTLSFTSKIDCRVISNTEKNILSVLDYSIFRYIQV